MSIRSSLGSSARRMIRTIALKVIPQPEPPIIWRGDFADWSAALAQCEGYDANRILQRVVSANRAVSEGKATFERDGLPFDEPEYVWPVLASLLHVATQKKSLHVVDIGGALGGTYHQHRRFLDGVEGLWWRVVEQPSLVEAGEREFTTDLLTFSSSLDAGTLADADVALFGSSLCYLEDPWAVLSSIEKSRVEYLLIDRTPFDERAESHRIAVQHSRLAADDTSERDSYPCWIFSRSLLEQRLSECYESVAWWVSDLQPEAGPMHYGCLWRRIQA